jgi:hypothetical protein
MIDIEVVKGDIERFFKAFNVDPIKKEKLGKKNGKAFSPIETIERLIQNDMLIVTDDGHLKYPLLEPIQNDRGENIVTEMLFRNRRIRLDEAEKLNDKETSELMKVKKMLSLLTGVEYALISKVSMDDIEYLAEISVFFMPAQ